jgi:hypothetical protein
MPASVAFEPDRSWPDDSEAVVYVDALFDALDSLSLRIVDNFDVDPECWRAPFLLWFRNPNREGRG